MENLGSRLRVSLGKGIYNCRNGDRTPGGLSNSGGKCLHLLKNEARDLGDIS